MGGFHNALTVFVTEKSSTCFLPIFPNSCKPCKVMASTVAVDEYFDELIEKVRQVYRANTSGRPTYVGADFDDAQSR